VPRCPWATIEPAIAYHDEEWDVPLHDDRRLFEFLILEGAQAGLSWITILKKRQSYRKAFDGFRAEKIARYGARDLRRLLGDPGIVRNRLKIGATIQNAKAFLALQEELESFDAYRWSFVGNTPIQNRWRWMAEVPAWAGNISVHQNYEEGVVALLPTSFGLRPRRHAHSAATTS
jgi:DNA-3-methyladenine glycosylase I